MDERTRVRKGTVYGALLGVFVPAATLALIGTIQQAADHYSRNGIRGVIGTFFFQFVFVTLFYGLFTGTLGALIGRSIAARNPKP